MLLEILWVIVLAAVVIVLGIKAYRLYQQRLEIELIRNDVVTVRAALNRYYEGIPCDSVGKWQGDSSDVIDKLDINPAQYSRSPYVLGYHAAVVDEGTLYHLLITADVDPLYAALMPVLTKRLNASRYEASKLYWKALPDSTVVEGEKYLWIMNGSRDVFRHLKNAPALGEREYTHAFCAR